MVMFISFPPEELPELSEQLKHGYIFTTRVMEEIGKYRPGMVVDSPMGTLQVITVSLLPHITFHPFYEELTVSQRDLIGDGEMELIRLVSYRS